ncbi:MAG: hypothetical protein KC656_14880, partial [Myxococcales bacterium]|nr:hypothetical protein [Myxococcales bacterium]
EARPFVVLYRVPEPRPGLDTSVQAERMLVRYPDHPHNAEALVVDRRGELYIVSKEKHAPSTLFALGPFQAGEVTARAVASRAFEGGGRGGEKVTGGDISPDGRWLALRTYPWIWLFPVQAELPGALLGDPCVIVPPVEEQGESIGFTANGLVIVSEGRGSPLQELQLQ